MNAQDTVFGLPSDLATSTIGIVGLGLMGGSLAMALRTHCARLLGCDHDPDVVKMALETRTVDAASTHPTALLAEADLVILAVPVRASLVWLQQLPGLHPGRTVVIDLGSTKTEVLRAMDTLPERFEPLGGHPMCGKEEGSLTNAEAGLFQHAPFALSPLPRTTHRARQMALDLVHRIGAHPLWIEAVEHDRWVAATSHLPHLLATALVLSTPGETAPLAGPGFRSTSRLAAGSAEMKTDIFATNQPSVLEALARFRQQLDIIETALRNGDLDLLQKLLTSGAQQRQAYLSEKP